MKKVLLGLAVVALLLGGVYYYYTNKISNRLDQAAAMAGPLVGLEYESVSLGLGGEVRINGLRLQAPNMPAELRVRQLALRAGNLYALWSLNRKLENGELPRSMGVALRGAEVPISMTAPAAGQGGSPGMGLVFDAAGCGQRREFDVVDLRAMGFDDLIADFDLQYEMDEYRQSLGLRLHSHLRGLAELTVNARIELGDTVNSLLHAAQGFSRARLGSMIFEYVDRGYYPRMLEFCRDETGMKEQPYFARHVSAWRQRWREAGFEVGESTVEAYRTFLAAPGKLEITLDPSYSPALMQFANTGASELVGQFRLEARVNDGKAAWLAFERLADESPVAAGSETASSTDADSARGASSGPRARPAESASGASTDARPRITGTVSTMNDSSAARTATEQPGVKRGPSGWRRVAPRELTDYVTYKIDVRMDNGNEYSGRVEKVSPGRVHLHVRGRGGFAVIPVHTDQIASVRVRER